MDSVITQRHNYNLNFSPFSVCLQSRETHAKPVFVFHFQCIFMFSCVWSFGASIDNTGRDWFDQFFREILSGPMSLELKDKYHILDMVDGPSRPYLCPFPSKGTVYEYRFIKEVKTLYEKYYNY